jgi:hypothetical protein
MTTCDASAARDQLGELRDGIAYWHSRSWPADLHNTCYDEWALGRTRTATEHSGSK